MERIAYRSGKMCRYELSGSDRLMDDLEVPESVYGRATGTLGQRPHRFLLRGKLVVFAGVPTSIFSRLAWPGRSLTLVLNDPSRIVFRKMNRSGKMAR